MFVLATALSAEQIKNPAMWQTFARIAVEKEYEVEAKEYFRNYANLAWAMAKIGLSDEPFWTFIERLFATELERTKLAEQSREFKSSVLVTICFALKDCKAHNFSDDFWNELNSQLRLFLQQRIEQAARLHSKGDTLDETESLSMIRTAVESNTRLDDSLLNML